MPEILIEAGAESADAANSTNGHADTRIYGVALAQVINNFDLMGLGRVQLLLPWLPGYQPWARVAVLMAGFLRGTYFIPQIGDEVLVAFNQGDVREPYVIGGLWNTIDRPPALLPTDPAAKRIIRSPLGHEIEFDDLLQSITITSTTKQKVKIDPTKIELSNLAGTATLTLGILGDITIKGAMSIDLKAPMINLNADIAIDVKSKGTTTVEGTFCDIKGHGMVTIN